MRLEELVVEDFKKLRGRHVVRPAPTGITVVSGDNEEGKSTLLEALKRAFFMKHNTIGEKRDAITPLGRDATPFVAVAFRIGERPYRLEKHFRRNGVRLEGPDGVLEGDAAELALARLLAFEWPGRGPASDAQMGLAGLFWVDQGTSFAPEQKPSATALRALEPALADQVASLGRGERAPRLMGEVRRKRDQHWTGKRGDAKGELLDLEKAVAGLRAAAARLAGEEQALEALLERLAQTLERRRTWLAADQLGRARAAVERTRSRLAGVKALEEEARVRSAQRQAAESELARLREKHGRRAQLEAAIDERSATQARLQAAAAEAGPALDRARRSRALADAAATQAQGALQAAESARERVARQAERLRLEQQLSAQERLVADVRAAAQDAAAQAGLAEAEAVTGPALATLEALTAELGQTRAALRAVATRLVLQLEPGAPAVRLDDAPLDPGRPIELTAPAVLAIDGVGRIEVTPGGERLLALRDALARDEAALAAGLAGLGCASLPEARRRLAAKERAQSAAQAAKQRMAALLRASGAADASSLDAAALKTRTRLAGLGDVALPEAIDEAAFETLRDTAEQARDEAREQLARREHLRRTAAQEEAELTRLADQSASAEAHCASELAKLQDQLAIERDELADADLALALTRARATADAAIEAAARIERELARAAPEAARQEAEQAARALSQQEAEARALDREVDRLEAELQGAGGRGIGDQRAEVQGRLELAQRRHARLLAEAQAWRLLSDTLEAVDRTRQDALVLPIRSRVAPYVRQLMGEASLAFDPDGLELHALERGGEPEPFRSLSIGTREQLAVLVRLAIGDLLAETLGQAPPLILDDALVYADAVRLARMKTLLQQAGRRQQIIVLTCRREDYLGLDAHYLRLEELRATNTS